MGNGTNGYISIKYSISFTLFIIIQGLNETITINMGHI